MKKININFMLMILMTGVALLGSYAYANQVNTKAPDFSLNSISKDKFVELQDYSGKVIYLDFWASWCAPCRASFPLLNKLHQQYKKEGFEVVAINLDDDLSDMDKFNRLYPVEFTLLKHNNNQVAEAYQVKAMPSSYIIDKKGNIRYTHHGFKKRDIVQIEQEITQLMAE
jgi:peroxiredoxin